MNKKQLDSLLESLVGADLVENWWNSPNRHWQGHTPISIYESSDEGKSEVENYILTYCFGK